MRLRRSFRFVLWGWEDHCRLWRYPNNGRSLSSSARSIEYGLTVTTICDIAPHVQLPNHVSHQCVSLHQCMTDQTDHAFGHTLKEICVGVRLRLDFVSISKVATCACRRMREYCHTCLGRYAPPRIRGMCIPYSWVRISKNNDQSDSNPADSPVFIIIHISGIMCQQKTLRPQKSSNQVFTWDSDGTEPPPVFDPLSYFYDLILALTSVDSIVYISGRDLGPISAWSIHWWSARYEIMYILHMCQQHGTKLNWFGFLKPTTFGWPLQRSWCKIRNALRIDSGCL